MSAPSDLVGRVAKLHNIVSKPELNGAYVLVHAYLQEKNRYLVETLLPPNTNDRAINMSVKVESLQVIPQGSFFDKYPHPACVDIVHTIELLRVMQDGIIVKLGALQRSERQLNLVFFNSHRMLGDKTPLDSKGNPQPRSTLTDNFLIAPTNEESIVEFEDIRFVGLNYSLPLFLFCVKGYCTVFRRCTFQNVFLQVAGNEQWITNSVTSRVCGDNYRGTPKNSFVGVEMIRKASELSMLNCTVIKCELCGVLFDCAEEVTIAGCKVENCKVRGIQGNRRGKRASPLSITDSHIAACDCGFSFEMGEFDALIRNTTIRNMHKNGVYIYPSVMGRVGVNQCCIIYNGDYNVLNASQAGCVVTVDGVKQAPVAIDYEPLSQIMREFDIFVTQHLQQKR
eukprot:gene7899-9417_t